MKKCEKCGNVGESKYCPECGGKMVEIEEPIVENDSSNDDEMPIEASIKTENAFENEGTNDPETAETVQTSGLVNYLKNLSTKSKIIIAVILLLVIIFIFYGSKGASESPVSNDESSSYDSSSSYSDSSTSYASDDMTESEAEDWAAVYLAKHLSEDKYQYKVGVAMAAYDIGSTRYSVGTVTSDGLGGYTVKGTFTLYDEYGKMSSSHYNETFEVHVYSAYSATVKTFLGYDSY